MAVTVNLDRAVEMHILYPFGVDETITMTYSEGTLTSDYQILIYDQTKTLIQTITEADAQFGKSGAVLTWNINYETGGLLTEGRVYSYEIRDTTNDYEIFYGDLTMTKGDNMATWTIASTFNVQVGTVTASDIVVSYLAGKDFTNDGSVDAYLNSMRLNTTPSGSLTEQGTFSWNADEETADLILNGATLQLGQETHWHVRNNSGADIPDGKAVMATGTIGGSGRITIGLYDGSNIDNAKYFLGVTTETIENNTDGKVTSLGKVRGVDTSAFNEGDVLWCDNSTPGGFTNVMPTTNSKLPIAFVVTKGASNGTLAIRATDGTYFSEAHDLELSNLTDGDIIYYDSTDSVFKNKAESILSESDIYEMRCNFNGAEAEALTCVQTAIDAGTGSSLLLQPSGFKATKLYSAIPKTGVGDFTHSRNSVATRVNADGLIEEMAVDVPRLDYSDASCPSLLLEPQSTNLLTYSEDFSDVAWIKARSAITLNATLSPDGVISADKLTDTTDSGTHIVYQQYSTGLGNTYTYSCFIKKSTLDYGFLAIADSDSSTIIYNLIDGIVEIEGADFSSSKIENYGNGWYKCLGTYDATLESTLFRVGACFNGINRIYAGTGADYIYIWGAQLEELSYPTSYIKTEGATATRLADVCNSAGDVNTFNSEEGVLFVEMSALADGVVDRYVSILDGTSNSYVGILYSSTSNKLEGRVRVAGTFTALLSKNDVTQTDYIKVALKWKVNDFALYVDGVEVATDTSGVTHSAGALNSLAFEIGGVQNLYGKVKDLRVYKTALTDAELITLTT